MHPSSRWLTAALMVSASLGCSARGGGTITSFLDGGPTDDSAVMPDDLGVGPDVIPKIDLGVPATDVGFPGTDTGKSPVDNGFPTEDLGTPPFCGDARCNGTETCMTCRDDCGACAPVCGDGTCGGGETCSTCSRDCGACAPVCGDGTCASPESCSTCPSDCGPCTTDCAAIGSCTACTSNPACGWCSFDGACQAGTSSGPSGSSTCALFGGWVRNATSCTVDAGVRDVGVTDTGVAANITATCSVAASGLPSDCGWRLGNTYTCTVGTTITLGCTGASTASDAAVCAIRVGTCAGDPMIRVCAGSAACTYANRLITTSPIGSASPEDDACGNCPVARYTCPGSGQVTVYVRPYTTGATFTCVPGRI